MDWLLQAKNTLETHFCSWFQGRFENSSEPFGTACFVRLFHLVRYFFDKHACANRIAIKSGKAD
ncbi:hypothetical protein [Paenibacillus sp. NPDC058071]|uniref:hypothetical protein n=1 Tax=Paenibacillus sp. NPDC058071 TaxID=3346326 RepID=UPI0036DCB8A5